MGRRDHLYPPQRYAALGSNVLHIPSDLVVDHWTSAVEGSSHLDFLSLHAMWTTFGGLISYKIMSIISVGCDFTTQSGGIWAGSFHDDPPVLGGIVYHKS